MQKEQVLASLSTGGADSAVEPEPAWELRVWPVGPVSPVSITAVASSPNVSFECHRKKAVADGVKCRKTKQSKSAKQAATEVQQHDGNPSHVGNMSASKDASLMSDRSFLKPPSSEIGDHHSQARWCKLPSSIKVTAVRIHPSILGHNVSGRGIDVINQFRSL